MRRSHNVNRPSLDTCKTRLPFLWQVNTSGSLDLTDFPPDLKQEIRDFQVYSQEVEGKIVVNRWFQVMQTNL